MTSENTVYIRVIYHVHTCHIPCTYVSYTVYIRVIYLVHTCHIPCTYVSYTVYIRVIYRVHTCHIPCTYVSYTVYIRVIYRVHTCPSITGQVSQAMHETFQNDLRGGIAVDPASMQCSHITLSSETPIYFRSPGTYPYNYPK